MVGPEIEARAWRVTAMSSAKLVSGIWTASALYCSACSKATTLLQLEASTKLPWTRTTLSPTPDAELCSASCELELAAYAESVFCPSKAVVATAVPAPLKKVRRVKRET